VEAQSHEEDGTVINIPFSWDALLEKRTWSVKKLKSILRIARREDHLEPAGQGMLRLSEPGFGEAARVTRNHRLWETYLIKHADIAPSHVDRDADMVEHILGAEMVRQLEADLSKREIEAAMPPSPHQIHQALKPTDS